MLVYTYSVIVFKYGEKIHFRENWLIFWGIWEEAELILGICDARQSTFRELRIFFRDWGD